MINYYSITDAAKLAGITRRQADYWAKIGLVEPAVIARRGNAGTIKLYNFEAIYYLSLAKKLINRGMSVQALRKQFDNVILREGTLQIVTAGGVFEVDMQKIKNSLNAVLKRNETAISE